MPLAYHYSKVAQAMRPSPIRELFKLIQRPGMISFAGGLPDPAIFPVREFASCAQALERLGKEALQYGATEGYGPLIEVLRPRMEAFLGRPLSASQFIIGSGSQQVMDMLGRVLLDPGDVVLVEAPTYPGALHTFRNCGARFAVVPCDENGMRTDKLPEVLEQCRKLTGALPKLVYTIVNFSNPSGACLATERRRELIEICSRYGIPIFEDDPYGELRYSGAPLPPIASMTQQGVLYASSFSKILAPGVRVAWAVGDEELIRKMVVIKQGMDLCSSVVAQVLVQQYCEQGYLDSHLTKIRSHYAAKAQAMTEALHRHLEPSKARWSDPQGGFFFWMQLPGSDSQEVFTRAVDKGVAFLPGSAFYPAPQETIGEAVNGASFARLCFTFAQLPEIEEGAKRLALALG